MILVTGCAGFIGARVCEMLLGEGETVVGVDNCGMAAAALRVQAWRLARLMAHSNFTYLRADVCDLDALSDLFETRSRPGAVIHLAAKTGVRASLGDPAGYLRTNALGTTVMLEFCRQHGIPKFVLASTSSVYGAAPLPFREEMPTDRPLSPYAASKKAAEVIASTYHSLYGLDVSVLRYFTVYGPAGRPDMAVWRFTEHIAGDQLVTLYGQGDSQRDYTFVDDIARGTLAALRPLGFEVINLGAGRAVPLSQMLALIEHTLGKSAVVEYGPPVAGEVLATEADRSKAQRLLGWEPQVPMEQGIAEFVVWYRAYADHPPSAAKRG